MGVLFFLIACLSANVRMIFGRGVHLQNHVNNTTTTRTPGPFFSLNSPITQRIGDGRSLRVNDHWHPKVIFPQTRLLKKGKYRKKKGKKKGGNKKKYKGKGMKKGKGGKGRKKGKSYSSYGRNPRGYGDENDICPKLGLGLGLQSRGGYGPASVFGRGKGGKGKKGYKRNLQTCSPDAREFIKDDPNFSIFFELLEATDLKDILSCEGPFTIMIPTNQAFQRNPDLLESLFNPRNRDLVQNMLMHHFIADYKLERDFRRGRIDTLAGSKVDIQTSTLRFDLVPVSSTDLTTCNAVLHAINEPLFPEGKS